MTVAVVTDSNVSLPSPLIRDLPLYVVPMELHHAGRVYRDGIDLTPAEFYALQQDSPTLPATSAPQPGAFLEAFARAAQAADDVVCLTLSSELSATYKAAIAAQSEAAATLWGAHIEVVDSHSAGTAQGLVALAAARLAKDGATAETVLAAVHEALGAVYLYGYLDTLYYVWRSGRVPRVVMWMGRLLGVKPILQLSNGTIGMVERTRTTRRALERVASLAVGRAQGAAVRIAVMHAAAPERAEELAALLTSRLAPRELFVTEFTPVIGAHTGPGLVGCALHRLPDGA